MPVLTASETAQRLVSRELAGGRAPDGTAAASQVIRRLADELAEWFGPFGAHSLMTRALAHAREAHSALDAVRVREFPSHELEGLGESVRVHGAAAAAVAAIDIVAALVDLLGRLINDELAMVLVEQSMRNGSSEPTSGGDGERSAGGVTGAHGDTTEGTTRHD